MIEQFNFVDKSFDAKNIDDYHLSLQVFLKGFSFCILDRQRNKFIALSHNFYNKIVSYKVLQKEIEAIVQQNEILNLPYQHVKLLFATPKSTLIPSTFFNNENAEEYFRFNHDLKTHEVLDSNYIFGNSSYVVYSQPKVIIDYFKALFPSLRPYHQSCPFIEEILLKHKTQTHSKSLYINCYPNFFDVIYLNNGSLQLYNSFVFKTPNDFQYFILNIFEQLKLSPREIPLYISGMIKKDDQKIETLKKYVNHLHYLNKPSHFEYSYGFHDFQEHFFINMINLYQCG